MAASKSLVDLLRKNLESVEEPANYQKLREKLMSIKTDRPAPSVKESPENMSSYRGSKLSD